MHGSGKFVIPNEQVASEGDVCPISKKILKRGEYTWYGGWTYEGQFVGGIKHGEGKLTFAGVG